jgi:cation-transporting P-type ATPase 13A2
VTHCVQVGRTLPFDRLHTKRPTANLVSQKVLASVIGQVLISAAFQIWAYLWIRHQAWQVHGYLLTHFCNWIYHRYEPPDQEGHGNQLESFNFENTALFLVSSFQYIFIAVVYSIGPPFRKPMWTNGKLHIYYSDVWEWQIVRIQDCSYFQLSF